MKMILEVLCLVGCGANIYLGLLLFIAIISALCSFIKDKIKKIKEKKIEKANKKQYAIKLMEDLRKELRDYNELCKELFKER